MQFMNSSLEKLVKNWPDNGFKYLTEAFGSKNLEPLKREDAYPYECIDRFKLKDLVKKKRLVKSVFIAR